jgi:hypothetical protein
MYSDENKIVSAAEYPYTSGYNGTVGNCTYDPALGLVRANGF